MVYGQAHWLVFHQDGVGGVVVLAASDPGDMTERSRKAVLQEAFVKSETNEQIYLGLCTPVTQDSEMLGEDFSG